MLDDGVPHGLPRYWKSGYFTELPEPVITTIVDGRRAQADAHLRRAVLPPARRRHPGRCDRYRLPAPHRLLGFRRHRPVVRARAGRRRGDLGPGLWASVAPSSSGVYVNHLDADDRGRVGPAYGPNFDRLVALKQKYDPDNFFRLNNNIVAG